MNSEKDSIGRMKQAGRAALCGRGLKLMGTLQGSANEAKVPQMLIWG